MDTNQLIKLGLLGAGALFIAPKILGSSQEDIKDSSGGGGVEWGSGFFGSAQGTSKGAVSGSEMASKKTSLGGTDDITIYTIKAPSVPIEQTQSKEIINQTKKESSTAKIQSSDPIGTTYPIYNQSSNLVSGYEVQTPQGGVSTTTPEAYGGSPFDVGQEQSTESPISSSKKQSNIFSMTGNTIFSQKKEGGTTIGNFFRSLFG